ncbi:MAG TPA: hypothetical protein VKT77_02195 [Chthonomonadaceae bacterium]|nr:hypothetical protein [Chthonomonadaceae bacterium]
MQPSNQGYKAKPRSSGGEGVLGIVLLVLVAAGLAVPTVRSVLSAKAVKTDVKGKAGDAKTADHAKVVAKPKANSTGRIHVVGSHSHGVRTASHTVAAHSSSAGKHPHSLAALKKQQSDLQARLPDAEKAYQDAEAEYAGYQAIMDKAKHEMDDMHAHGGDQAKLKDKEANYQGGLPLLTQAMKKRNDAKEKRDRIDADLASVQKEIESHAHAQ